MKMLRITLEGKTYDVGVEVLSSDPLQTSHAPAPAPGPALTAAVAAPPAPVPAPLAATPPPAVTLPAAPAPVAPPAAAAAAQGGRAVMSPRFELRRQHC